MVTGTLKRMGRPRKAEPTEGVRIPVSFVKKLRRLALHHELDPGDYLVREFAAGLEKRHAKMLKEQASEAGSAEEGRPGDE